MSARAPSRIDLYLAELRAVVTRGDARGVSDLDRAWRALSHDEALAAQRYAERAGLLPVRSASSVTGSLGGNSTRLARLCICGHTRAQHTAGDGYCAEECACLDFEPTPRFPRVQKA